MIITYMRKMFIKVALWVNEVHSIYFYGLGRLFSFSILYTVGRTLGWGISPAQGLYLHAVTHKERINIETFVHWFGFECKFPMFDQAKTFHTLDLVTTVNSHLVYARVLLRSRISAQK
jgi:hypothetical protein